MRMQRWLMLPTHSQKKRIIIRIRMHPYRLVQFRIEMWTGSSTSGLLLGQFRMLRQTHEAKSYKNIRPSSKGYNPFRGRSKSKR